MDYSLDEQQQEVAALAATILGDLVTPERLAALDVGDEPHDTHTWLELARAGLLGIAVPEDQGGSGASLVELGLVVEAAARASAPLFLVEGALAADALSRWGNDGQRSRLLAGFCEGDVLLTSATARTSTASPGFTLSSSEAGTRLHGAVSHVPLAGVADRIVVAVCDEQGSGLVLLDPTAPGVELQEHPSLDRRRRWRVVAEDVQLGPDDILLTPGQEGDAVALWHDVAASLIAVRQYGTAARALDMAADHARQRQQFGRAIGSFQAVSHAVADAFIDLQGIRLTAWRALWLVAHELPATEDVRIAAYWATDAARRILEAAMQVHGGVSVDLDYPLHRYFLAARHDGLLLGGPSGTLDDLGRVLVEAR